MREIEVKKGMRFNTPWNDRHHYNLIGDIRSAGKKKLLELPIQLVEITNITGTRLAEVDMVIVKERFKSGVWILI